MKSVLQMLTIEFDLFEFCAEVIACVALKTVRNGAQRKFQLMENHRHLALAQQLQPLLQTEVQLIYQQPN